MGAATLKARISKLEDQTMPIGRNIVVQAPDGLGDGAIDVILADHGVTPIRADQVVYIRRLAGADDGLPTRVLVNSVEQRRIGP